ncbi:DUF2272 domain-containing protein [Cupriavidus basilensis]|uniref:DUF2272 domain-containing protein n=1 Tax=Cupriavidus basilensis TaxID=68895 RepID=UPI0023E77527|nr:DUF2272 domain-containing protein [Cupriavidus basilensis]MDF3884111.1 DUF2272 domain-containing protein [Cupriavidus basilensis]
MSRRSPPGRFPQFYSQRFPQNFPQARRLGLSLLTALALLSGCTMPSQPARPQAIPLPDTERPATTPGATQRQRIVEIAWQEWQRWGGQTVRLGRDDTACVADSPLPAPVLPGLPAATDTEGNPDASDATGRTADREDEESSESSCLHFPDGTGMEATAQGCRLAQRYWAIVGKAVTCHQITQGSWAWSAVFISWVMRKAGLDDRQFLTGDSHSMYVVDARDGILPAPAFRIEPLPAMPRPGDVICAGRGSDKYLASVAAIGFGTTPMHCDIVVEVDPAARMVKAIGGNVQQSVSMELIELGDSGMIDGVTNSHMPWLLVMRNTLP